MDAKNIGIPNVFYDIIVFISPSILVAVGIMVGLSRVIGEWLNDLDGSIGAIDIVIIVLILIFIAYEYGRMAEATSHLVVAELIRKIRKWERNQYIFKDEDFSGGFSDIVESLELPREIEQKKRDNKWTIYFFALLYCPNIGQDLLKRYAWEKLARSSAFTFTVLMTGSVVAHILRIFLDISQYVGDIGFGTVPYTSVSVLFVLVTYNEYYKRKCWNNDLLKKVAPVLLSAREMQVKNYKMKLE